MLIDATFKLQWLLIFEYDPPSVYLMSLHMMKFPRPSVSDQNLELRKAWEQG